MNNRDWEDEQLLAIFGPPTLRERIAHYRREMRREISNPEFWIALACLAAVLIVRTFVP